MGILKILMRNMIAIINYVSMRCRKAAVITSMFCVFHHLLKQLSFALLRLPLSGHGICCLLSSVPNGKAAQTLRTPSPQSLLFGGGGAVWNARGTLAVT